MARGAGPIFATENRPHPHSWATGHQAELTLSYREQKRNKELPSESEALMLILDPAGVAAIAVLITAISTLIWSLRRKP